MATCILLRHGQSLWNKDNLFTGWVNIGLSPKGVQEAIAAGELLQPYTIDTVFVSELIRAQQTAMLATMNRQKATTLIPSYSTQSEWHSTASDNNLLDMCTPMHADWRLNERYYGDLQGLNKHNAIQEHGAEQVHIWRRSFDVPPPRGESLKMTYDRTIPMLQERIIPALKRDENLLVVAHGNSLRAIMMYIERIAEEDITQLEIATGKPILYNWDVVTGFNRQTI